MTTSVKLTLPNYDLGEIEVFELDLTEKSMNWHLELPELDLNRDQPQRPVLGKSFAGYDLLFKFKNKYYLLPYVHPHFDMIMAKLSEHEGFAWEYRFINSSYAAARRWRLTQANCREAAPLPKRKAYAPDWIFTGAPSMAAGMTLAPLTSNALVKAGAPSAIHAPLMFPMLAGVFTYVLTYASNWVSYRLKYGVAPSEAAKRKLHSESMLRGGQITAGFFLCEATRTLFETACESALDEAWGGVLQFGPDLYPTEIKLAVMASVGLAVALGGTLAFGLWQYWNNKKTGAEFDFSLLPVVFMTGFIAGAVSTIEFRNQAYSFLATWAALCLFPLFNSTREQGRKELVETAHETKKTVLHLGNMITGKQEEPDYTILPQEASPVSVAVDF